MLIKHHFPPDQTEATAPLTQEEIQEVVEKTTGGEWSQPTVSRYMKLLFKKGGMREYTRLCLSKTVVHRNGILKKYEDGSTSVDAIVDGTDEDLE